MKPFLYGVGFCQAFEHVLIEKMAIYEQLFNIRFFSIEHLFFTKNTCIFLRNNIYNTFNHTIE